MKHSIKLIILGCLGITVGLRGESPPPISYSRQVQPVLAEYCYACHGPDGATRKADLRLDLREMALGELPSGSRAIVPGKPHESALVRKLFATDPDELMPPPGERKQPTAADRRLLRDWVAQGAPYEMHWSFRPIKSPPIPKVRDTSWPRNAIDHFVLARLEAGNMKPSPEADPGTLFRRLSLDLRGLPPSLGEMDAFLKNPGFESYLRRVDEILASRHYGERMAQDWLDLARYGDTNGYHSDSDRAMWLYRDYVIAAFNQNKPFDQFIRENMAGDLLPDATDETRIASGFHRCVTFNEEGGADPDEFYVTYAVDRANTTGQVFLGMTVGCAQCHDHKYDPISQKEFYQLYAFFNSIDGEIGAGGRSGYHNKPLPPLLKYEPPERLEAIQRLDKQIADAAKAVADEKARPEYHDPEGALKEPFETWLTTFHQEAPATLSVTNGIQLWLDAGDRNGDGRKDRPVGLEEIVTVDVWRDKSGHKRHATATGRPVVASESFGGRPGVELNGKSEFFRTESGGESLAGDYTMFVVFRMTWADNHQMLLMWGDEANGKRRALWKTSKENKISFNGYHADVVGETSIKVDPAYIASITQSGKEPMIRIAVNGKAAGEGKAALEPFENKAITIGGNNAGKELSSAILGEVLVFDRVLDDTEHQQVGRYLAGRHDISDAFDALPRNIRNLIALPDDKRTLEDRKKLLAHYVENVHSGYREAMAELEGTLESLKTEQKGLQDNLPTTMVMVEMKERKPAYVLMRGDFQQPTDLVEPDVPAVFPRLPPDQPRNRLGLAHWLTGPEHPLVARVTVNRIWKQLFGEGLVRTPGDFGTQGERPTHPELLDWLAADFIDHGWDVKRLQKMIVRSATYRQASVHHHRYNTADPDNRFLSRAPRFRLSAEEIRDSALFISGLFNPEIGGPSVKPHQPEGYLQSIGKNWKTSQGGDLYRRGLYTFWRRTMLYPTYALFDAPSREFCTVKRPRTNTPLQALATLNDPVFVEAATALGRRILKEGGLSDADRLSHGFRLATARPPKPPELALLLEALGEQRDVFRKDPEAAGHWVGHGSLPMPEAVDPPELAAWVSMANIVLNLDEVIMRE